MKYRWFGFFLLALSLAVAGPAVAAVSEVRPGILVNFSDLPSTWQMSTEPPEILVRQSAAHISPGQLAAARKTGIDNPEDAARQMLKGNELFLYNPHSGAHVKVDFSPLRIDEAPPRARTLKASAHYAAESLQGEEGIEGATSKVGKARLAGVKAAYRIDAEYRMHGEPTRFIGIVSFAHDHWIYLYYTGPNPGLEDLKIANAVFESFLVSQKQ